jgi:hypothetical protein
MDDIDFSLLPVGELAEYAWTNDEGRCAASYGRRAGSGFVFCLVSLRRNRTGAAVPAM